MAGDVIYNGAHLYLSEVESLGARHIVAGHQNSKLDDDAARTIADTREYLDVAFDALRGRGTILYHELCPKEQYPDAVTRRLAAAARSRWMNVVSVRTRIVKSYAPGIVHAAAELAVRPHTRRRSTEILISDGPVGSSVME